ncbi:MFS general substrate transporter-43 [Coleophoma cylindrospora]|uniref:MFS general substrate transporter-43 n=1 Tax=Coleophoma cylindrospora TaxID=1849047 RepID=A0A3D8RBK4_9HELO|nr:MFS general substrate transporter-43 [Coleophoma cylindrospora]
MALSNPENEVSENSPLLGEPTLTKSITGAEGIDGSRDAEAGVGEVREMPLFEGNKVMIAKLPYLLPPLVIGVLLIAADQTITVTSYGRIGTDLNALNSTSWIATGYYLTMTSFQPLYGKLSDIFGRKACILFAYAVFGIGCVFCGLARNIEELVLARAFAGIGGGGMTTVVSILLSDIVPLRERGTWQGYLNIVYTIGSSSGAALGGILADTIGWRWSFLGQGPLCFIAFGIVYFVLDLPQQEDTHWREKLGRIDFLGAFTLVIAVFSLLLGLDRGSNVAWSDTITIVACCLSIPLFALFLLVEMKFAANPFAPGHIIFERSLCASYFSNFFQLASYMACLFYVPLYFQAVGGMSATAAGMRFIPLVAMSTAGSLAGGVIMQRTGKYYWLTVISYILQAIGILGVTIACALHADSWWLLIALIFGAVGGGAAITTTLINVIANADAKDQAVATACTYLFRSLGSVVGVSIGGTVIQQVLRKELRSHLKSGHKADQIVERVRQSLDYINELDPRTRALVRICYQKAETVTFALAIAVAVGAIISSSFMREKKLSK